MNEVRFAAGELKQLIGGKIVDTVITEDDDSYGFIVEIGESKKVCWIDCDPEGNGPGWISIQDKDEDEWKVYS